MSFWLRAQEIVEDRESLDSDPGWEARTPLPNLGALLAALEPPSPQRLSELRRMDYWKEYLRTPEWRQTRRSALLAAGKRCQRCDRYGGLLDVHHLSYARRGAELPGDLIVLCRSCHKLQHKEG